MQEQIIAETIVKLRFKIKMFLVFVDRERGSVIQVNNPQGERFSFEGKGMKERETQVKSCMSLKHFYFDYNNRASELKERHIDNTESYEYILINR